MVFTFIVAWVHLPIQRERHAWIRHRARPDYRFPTNCQEVNIVHGVGVVYAWLVALLVGVAVQTGINKWQFVWIAVSLSFPVLRPRPAVPLSDENKRDNYRRRDFHQSTYNG